MTTLQADKKFVRTNLNMLEVVEQPCKQFRDKASLINWEMEHDLLDEYYQAKEGPRKQSLYRQCLISNLL